MFSSDPTKRYEELSREIRRGSTETSRRASRRAAGRVQAAAQTMRAVARLEMEMRTRSVEAFFACAMLGFGLIFLIPGRTLDLPGWGFVREWVEFFPGTEYRMGAILILVGTIRIAALIVNGHWYPTPAARLFGCMVGCLWWTTCATSFLLAVNTAGAFPTQIAWTFTAIVFEVFSAARAAADMHVMDTLGLREAKARRDGSGAG